MDARYAIVFTLHANRIVRVSEYATRAEAVNRCGTGAGSNLDLVRSIYSSLPRWSSKQTRTAFAGASAMDDYEGLALTAPRLLLRPGESERVASLRWDDSNSS